MPPSLPVSGTLPGEAHNWERVYLLEETWATVRPRLYEAVVHASRYFRATSALLARLREERLLLQAQPGGAPAEQVELTLLQEKLLEESRREYVSQLKAAARSAALDVPARREQLAAELSRLRMAVQRLLAEGVAPSLCGRMQRRARHLEAALAECEAVLADAPASSPPPRGDPPSRPHG